MAESVGIGVIGPFLGRFGLESLLREARATPRQDSYVRMEIADRGH